MSWVRVPRGDKPCKWCQALAGQADSWKDINFARHSNCQCAIIDTEGRTIDVGSKKGVWDRKNLDDFKNDVDFELKKIIKIPKKGNRVPGRKEPFKPAKTIQQARMFAEKVLGLKTSNYSKMNLDIANMINEEIYKIFSLFGKNKLSGSLKEIGILMGKKRFVAAYYPLIKAIYLKNSVAGNKKSFNEMLKMAENQFNMGYWSTKQGQHIIRHELGHAVSNMLLNNKKYGEIDAIRRDILNKLGITKTVTKESPDIVKEAGQYLSYYGLTNVDEFIAESIAEYLAGNPRSTATKVMNILLGKEE